MIEKFREIDNLIFEYKDRATQKEREDLKAFLEYELNLLLGWD